MCYQTFVEGASSKNSPCDASKRAVRNGRMLFSESEKTGVNGWISRINASGALSPSMSRISSSVCKRLEGAFICVLGGITCVNDPHWREKCRKESLWQTLMRIR